MQSEMFSPLAGNRGNELVTYTPPHQLPSFFTSPTLPPTYMAMPYTPVVSSAPTKQQLSTTDCFVVKPAALSLQPVDLYVSNLDPVAVVDDDDLAAIFRTYGNVMGAKLAVDHNGHSLGVGFVRMSTAQEAEVARLQVQGRGQSAALADNQPSTN